jgi:GDPmannose 4,6-dehydratase
MKTALITGVTGQDGSYLSEMLLAKGYLVHGIIRRASVFTTQRVDHLRENGNFKLHHGDLNDSSNLFSLINQIRPNEVYHLGAQSHVGVSFDVPEYTGDVTGLGTLRLLNAIKSIDKGIRFYNAATSEMFGGIKGTEPQTEITPFHPRSPYGIAKLYSYWATVNYREAFDLFATNGILFNHESPRRGETFVTRKITKAVAARYKNREDVLLLGNLDALRDWGFAGDYVEAMWLITNHFEPEDFVIATGRSCSVREFTEKAFSLIGIELEWVGAGVNEVAIDKSDKSVLVKIDPRLYRPSEVECLVGDATKARSVLNWEPKVSLEALIELMVKHDISQDN